MGSQNSKVKSKHSVVGKWKVAPYEIKIHGVNRQEEDIRQFSLTGVEFSLVPDRDGDTVCLRGLKFFFKLTRAVSAFDICSLSNESYLISNQDNMSVEKLDASTGDIISLRLPGLTGALCSLDKNRAAVSSEKIKLGIHYQIFILDTNRGLRKISSFSVKEKCLGMAYLDEKLYIGHSKDITIYSTKGRHLKTIFRQDTGTFIKHLTKGPNRQLICVTAGYRCLIYTIVEEDGSKVERVYTQAKYPPFPYVSRSAFNPNLATIDSYGNVYVYINLKKLMEQTEIVKITRERRIEAQTYPLDVRAMCFDESFDMLALMSDKKFVLGSPI